MGPKSGGLGALRRTRRRHRGGSLSGSFSRGKSRFLPLKTGLGTAFSWQGNGDGLALILDLACAGKPFPEDPADRGVYWDVASLVRHLGDSLVGSGIQVQGDSLAGSVGLIVPVLQRERPPRRG